MAAKREAESEAPTADAGAGLEALSEAIESGAGLPALARAATGAVGASVALIDRSSAVLAVSAPTAAEERRLLDSGSGVESIELRVADSVVGELRYRAGSAGVPAGTLRMVATLLALEVERARAPGWADDEAAQDLVSAILERRLVEPTEIAERAADLGADLSRGGGVIAVRAHPRSAQAGEWRDRLLMLTLRAAGGGALSAGSGGDAGEVTTILAAPAAEQLERIAAEIHSELATSFQGFEIATGHSRHVGAPQELYRAGREAVLALNVGEAEDTSPLAFEATGSYRLLLPALSEDPGELERFYEETVAPLAAYDDQYETELVATVEAYLANDGNVTPTAETLFTHRHTVRYRLERVRELCGLDLTSTEGREKVGLGLKAMRVLGIPAPRGPATEPRGKAASGKGSRE